MRNGFDLLASFEARGVHPFVIFVTAYAEYAVEAFAVDKPSTKDLIAKLQDYAGRTLIVTENVDQNLFLSARNLAYVAVVDVAAMDPVSLVDARHLPGREQPGPW